MGNLDMSKKIKMDYEVVFQAVTQAKFISIELGPCARRPLPWRTWLPPRPWRASC